VTARRWAALALGPLLATGCGGAGSRGEQVVELWALGREGEVVREMLPAFERENPGVRVALQQIPWTAAHEKILTAIVGGAVPDVAQVGNTWIPEMVVLDAIEPLAPHLERSTTVRPEGFFPGIWETSLVDGTVYGVPWYVDTRVLFYRTDILARAGCAGAPRTWEDWLDCLRRVKSEQGENGFAILLPTDEWAQPVILGLQTGAELLADNGTRAAFSEPRFARAFDFYVGMFRAGLAPVLSNAQVGNLYQQFAEGRFAMYVTGPWNLGEFRRRLPAATQPLWATAPMPAPDGDWPGASLAGGSSLVLLRTDHPQDAAWRLVEFLARPDQQTRLYALCGDLPARVEAWQDPALASDPQAAAFFTQLQRVRPVPRVAEWERIATRTLERAEEAIRGRSSPGEALAALDRDVDRMLAKRRWVLARRAPS
jgi:multiple sugar transport system substrate-binding protein